MMMMVMAVVAMMPAVAAVMMMVAAGRDGRRRRGGVLGEGSGRHGCREDGRDQGGGDLLIHGFVGWLV
jgi:hypothetical protein